LTLTPPPLSFSFHLTPCADENSPAPKSTNKGTYDSEVVDSRSHITGLCDFSTLFPAPPPTLYAPTTKEGAYERQMARKGWGHRRWEACHRPRRARLFRIARGSSGNTVRDSPQMSLVLRFSSAFWAASWLRKVTAPYRSSAKSFTPWRQV